MDCSKCGSRVLYDQGVMEKHLRQQHGNVDLESYFDLHVKFKGTWK